MSCSGDSSRIDRRPFEIIAFDWDGTAVKNREVDASAVTAVLEELLKLGVTIAVITGTNFNNIDRQFSSLIAGPHKQNLFIGANRGSEIYGFDRNSMPVVFFRREATAEENQLLDRVAEAVKSDIEHRSLLNINIIYDRLNRRKIDLIPEWENPPKSRIGELITRTQKRLRDGGYKEGIGGAFDLAVRRSRELGLADARITSDVKHIEVGLTDKADAIRWLVAEITRRQDVSPADFLVLGDEFGPIAGFDGSDFHMVVPEPEGITYVSVGKEPNGVPAGVLHLGGGPACFMKLMKRQIGLRHRLAVTDDPSFLLVEEGFNPLREREIESLFAVSNGYLGTRGSLEERNRHSGTATLIAGVYDSDGPEGLEQLAIAPDWLYTRIHVSGRQLALNARTMVEHERTLDLKKGVYRRHWRYRDRNGRVTSIHFLRFVSLADPHALIMRVSVLPENYSAMMRLETGMSECEGCRTPLQPVAEKGDGTLSLLAKTSDGGIIVSMAQRTRVHQRSIDVKRKVRIEDGGVFEDLSWQGEMGRLVTLEKYVSVYTSKETADPLKSASSHVNEIAGHGLTELLLEHTDSWEERWESAGISLGGDPPARRWLNFSIYHLISAGNPHDERVSISARGLTGTIYGGHIFWDAEIFTLPFFVFTHPATARAMLMYRYHTLPAARKNAAEAGYRGAMFAWESAESGQEMTPKAVLSSSGEVVPVTAGEFEDHIIADIAYGVWFYWHATGDTGFLLAAGAELLMETARFWVSRSKQRGDSYHILRVEGPDEYHDEGVDDNFYTNSMAAWNIERALEAAAILKRSYRDEWSAISARIGLKAGELRHWQTLAAKMFRGAETQSGVIEQFAGYFSLDDLDIHDYEPKTVPLDVILGHDRTVKTQAVKQADVVMALYLLERELSGEAIRESFSYYERRTDHGSSLSPAMYGLVATRLGMMDKGLAYFRRAGRIDLANNMGNAAGGVHLAAMGGLWQQLIMGFAGVRAESDCLCMYPRLPGKWTRLAFKLLWHGRTLELEIIRNRVIRLKLEGSGEVPIGIFGREVQQLAAPGTFSSEWNAGTWGEFTRIPGRTGSIDGGTNGGGKCRKRPA